MNAKSTLVVSSIAVIAMSVSGFTAYPARSSVLAVAQAAPNFRSLASSDLLVLGPVESVNAKSLELRILGQIVALPASQQGMADESLVGRMVAVYGSLKVDGSLKATSVSELSSAEYVPGATHVYIRGVLTYVDRANAVARIGSLAVNYSDALHSLIADDLAVGKVVSFGGVAFAGNGRIYADNGSVHTANPLGQAGSDAKSMGQAGSDAKSMGQAGSDKKANGQAGSDHKAMGQAGSDAKSMGQAGSDNKAMGQAGSDKKANGQAGSDKKANGQAGSDKKANGQAGSDKKANGQAGSDKKANGQAGSD